MYSTDALLEFLIRKCTQIGHIPKAYSTQLHQKSQQVLVPNITFENVILKSHFSEAYSEIQQKGMHNICSQFIEITAVDVTFFRQMSYATAGEGVL